ncbi:MAG: DUF1828 domain-containing protein [Chloroflexi bacterium]|nr:DUF1828 domain-containing protein [Chloroflexota bacterium]
MDIARLVTSLNEAKLAGFNYYERRRGRYQLIAPILHEDGDMVDIYLQDSPLGEGFVRVCDFGLTLMRLSYTYDISTSSRKRIFESILINNGVGNEDGNLYLDSSIDMLYESILQFAGCAQKVCNMRYWSREVVRSAFYDDLNDYVATDLTRFEPLADQFPIPEYPISVDWSLTHNAHNFYVFGVRGNDKAKNVAIALLEFQKARLPFISLVVHEDMEDLGKRERFYLTSNADVQYPALNEFRERVTSDLGRFTGATA